jgi:hypothetical protein
LSLPRETAFPYPTAFETTNKALFASGENAPTFVVANGGGASGLDFAATVSADDGVAAADEADGGAVAVGGESHGQGVSRVARDTPPGPGHGQAVREAAQGCR